MDHVTEPGDAARLRTFAIATLTAMVVLTVLAGALVYAIAPEHGARSAFGIGALVGFWMSPLPGGVASCAVHERRAHSGTSVPAVAEPAGEAPAQAHAAA